MRYAVAYMDFFNNDLQLIVVMAPDPITALVEGVRKIQGPDEWFNSLLENIPESKDYSVRIEEIRQKFFDSDQLVAVMSI